MTSLASAVISVGVRLVPQQERRRYAEEFEADVQSQPRWGRLPYAVSLVLGMPHLRWEILTRRAGQPVPFCFVGMHRNLTVRPNPDDASIIAKQCTRCGRIHDPNQYGRRGRANDLRSWYSANSGS